jgi:predicted transcriptional regulator
MIMTEMVRFCNLARDKTHIRNRFSLNSIQAEAYLTILKQRQLLTHDRSKYHITERGKSFIAFCDKLDRKRKAP